MFAVAFESAFKLVAFILVGLFVTYGAFDGFGEIYSRMQTGPYAHLMSLGEGSIGSYLEWTSLIFLSMMAILFLPRQFHVAVVANYSADHIRKAVWLFPLYLFLINIFVLPIAYGGLLAPVINPFLPLILGSLPVMASSLFFAFSTALRSKIHF